MSITVCIGLIVLALFVVYFVVSVCLIKNLKKKLAKAEIRNIELNNECDLLALELKNLHATSKKKQEVENETKKNLADIASGTTDDSVARLQHPEKRRKPKAKQSTSSNGNS